MKKTVFAFICALGVLSFASSKNIKNDNLEDFCNETYVINGGAGCIYNGTYPGWCSQEEFEQFANNVYATSGCSRPTSKAKTIQ